jgi:restriction endonuclease S subunit
MKFNIPSNIASENLFLVNFSDLENRLEPEYYKPSIVAIENSIREKSSKKLRDFIDNISSGATPSVKEENKYYATKEDGTPFLRVQNLNPNGQLDLEDVKYINKETHEGYLKRSQVAEGDLLVKITGVGRMAIASVAPKDFVGNTNQHMVVIRTGNREVSEYLANYLNLDLVENLATRRATGATRPALDYPALKSIPIIENINFSTLRDAIDKKIDKDKEASEILNSIDEYLLEELGIEIPKIKNDLENRLFYSLLSEVSGDRIEAEFYSKENRAIQEAIAKSKYELKKIKSKCNFIAGYAFSSSDYVDFSSCQLITIKNIKKNVINTSNATYLPNNFYEKYSRFKIVKDDLLIAMTGATIGKVGIYEKESNSLLNQRNGIIRSTNLNVFYLMNLLNLECFQKMILRYSVGGAQPNISESAIMNLQIPLPNKEVQDSIARNIINLREKAAKIQTEAENILINAKQKIEQQLLN